MPSKLLALFALPCFVIAGIAQTPPPAAEPRLEQAFKDIDALLKEWAPGVGPGCVYAAARDGRTLFTRTYGMADLEHDVPVTAESVFNVGSVSKQFTAAAALLLVQDGKLRLDDDIRKYLPEMPDYGRPITIRHLLNHTSGLREWTQLESLSGRPLNWHAYRNADVLKIAARQRGLNHAPGDRYSYTNTGYVLLAIIVERVSGSSLPEFTRERLFKPLGMNSTGWDDDPRRIVKHRANGYRKAASKSGAPVYAKAESVSGVGNTYGSASLLTTVGDLLIWNDALDSGSLGAFVTTELQRKGVLNDGRTISYGA
ncbi:MAG: beta-lactamase family protein, partial [Acidobacteriota bacterium]|nr:beta-lactamase family protein [Acidobacteriota bacterium]